MSKRRELQPVAISRYLLPCAAMGAVASWLFLSSETSTRVGSTVSLAVAALLAYMVAELSTRFSLLRVSSDIHAALFVLLIAMVGELHDAGTWCVVALLYATSLFFTLISYQTENPPLALCSGMCVSLISTVFPAFLFLVPVYLVGMMVLRSLTPRSLVAFVLGLMMPYWFWMAGILLYDGFDGLAVIAQHLVFPVKWGDYAAVSPMKWAELALAAILFIAGTVNFYSKSYLDKSRVRVTYYVIITHGIAFLLFILLQIHHFIELFPLFSICSAFMGGHHLAHSNSRIIRIYSILLLTAWVAIVFMEAKGI